MTASEAALRDVVAQGPVAQTAAGPVRGLVSNGVLAFRAIPYAASTAERRFEPPQPPEPWTEVREARDYRSQAPQMPRGGKARLYKSWNNPVSESEDCLHVHVWTPSLDSDAKRPVMVWLHGGAFSFSSASKLGYDGARLAARGDVVVVNVTHRLNAFGHLYLKDVDPSLADSGNVGMLDVVEALKWVRDNIANFSGDAGNVTIFGVSGGGGKVTVLMAMPSAKGLFHRAIVQSSSTGIGGRTAAPAAEEAAVFMKGLGLEPGDTDALRALPMERIKEASGNPAKLAIDGEILWSGYSMRDWRPVVDGRSLPERPFMPTAHEVSAHVPLLITTCKDESRLHLGETDDTAFEMDWEELQKRLTPLMQMEVSPIIEFYREQFPDATASDLYFKIYTYWRWRLGAIWQAERQLELSNAGPVYMSRLDWESPIDGGRWKTPHSCDVAFVFDTVGATSSLMGEETEDTKRMVDQMSEAWIAFARTGNPNHDGIPHWPLHDLSTRQVMCFNTTSEVVSDPEQEERLFYATELPKISL